ncbi:MAG: 50S ribosomal protein L29 [bacterium]
MKFKELKGKSTEELKKLLLSKKNKIRELKFKSASGQLKNFNEIKVEKRDVARISMLLNDSMKNKKSVTKKDEQAGK